MAEFRYSSCSSLRFTIRRCPLSPHALLTRHGSPAFLPPPPSPPQIRALEWRHQGEDLSRLFRLYRSGGTLWSSAVDRDLHLLQHGRLHSPAMPVALLTAAVEHCGVSSLGRALQG